jgi:hypothetical protein
MIKKLGLIMRGDLDWIVMKCLEKDRTRRYETANGLAADIKRHLNDETVMAGAPQRGVHTQEVREAQPRPGDRGGHRGGGAGAGCGGHDRGIGLGAQ